MRGRISVVAVQPDNPAHLWVRHWETSCSSNAAIWWTIVGVAHKKYSICSFIFRSKTSFHSLHKARIPRGEIRVDVFWEWTSVVIAVGIRALFVSMKHIWVEPTLRHKFYALYERFQDMNRTNTLYRNLSIVVNTVFLNSMSFCSSVACIFVAYSFWRVTTVSCEAVCSLSTIESTPRYLTWLWSSI